MTASVSVSPPTSGSAAHDQRLVGGQQLVGEQVDRPERALGQRRLGEDAEQLRLHGVGVLQRGVPVGRVHRLVAGHPVVRLGRRRRDPGHGAVAALVLTAPALLDQQAAAVPAGRLLGRLAGADDRVEVVDARVVGAGAGGDGAVELGRGRRLGLVDALDPAGQLLDGDVAVAQVDARVRRQELVHGRQRAQQPAQVDELERAELLDEPVGEEVERVERAAVGRAERDQRPRVLPAVHALEVVAGDEAAHRVADEDQLGVGVVLAPGGQLLLDEAVQPAGGDAVVATPVVRELEVRLAGHEVEALEHHVRDAGVAVDAPQTGDDVDVGHQAGGDDAVAEVVGVDRVVGQLERLDAAPERPQRLADGAGRRRPHLLAVTGEDAPEDAREQHDDVTEWSLGHGHLPHRPVGPAPVGV